MKESINFDRAASIYDASRKLPTTDADAITQALLAEIRASGADRLLEVGIGTGRMARPLMLAGVQMTGVDISTEMMGQLRAQLTPRHMPPDLVLGDATALPLRDDSFPVAMLVHVLHLVSSIEGALAELRRVLEPGGVLLHQTRAPTPETKKLWDDSHAEFGRLLEARGFLRRSRFDEIGIRERIRGTGASLVRLINVTSSTETSSVDDEMHRLRARSQSWTWAVPNDLFDDALPEYEVWLRKAAPNGWTDHVTLQLEVWRWD